MGDRKRWLERETNTVVWNKRSALVGVGDICSGVSAGMGGGRNKQGVEWNEGQM
jgi:hypothetical protein